MSASFEEKSVWIQLLSMVLVLGGYFVVALRMADEGVEDLRAYVPLFTISVVLQVVVMVVGHIVAAATSRSRQADERDRQIAWRAESRASGLLGLGILVAITGMVFQLSTVWIAHLLLGALMLNHLVTYLLQLIAYRRGF